MNTGQYYMPSFYRKHEREIKEAIVMLSLLGFGTLYHFIAPVRFIVDKGVDPAVEGLTVLYGKITTPIYRFTRANLGFVSLPPDQDFLFSVRLASYINGRRAAPLLDIAVDNRFTNEQRTRALMALLKFETTADWIQPFLNELPKGGLLGIYDDDSPVLDDLMRKIRAEGGVRQPLVRAYAEVVFSFMLQVPDLVIRIHACEWLSDVLAEDAIFLLVPRLEKEKDPRAQLALEQALYDVRAVSDPQAAQALLIPILQKPPWPSLKLPLAMVLSRLGYEGAAGMVSSGLQSEEISKEQRLMLTLAKDRTPYPRQLKITEKEERLLAERKKLREAQMRMALEKREQIMKQERIRHSMLARAEPDVALSAAARPLPPAPATEPVERASAPEVAAQPEPAKTSMPASTETKQRKVDAVATAPRVAEEPKAPPKQFPIPGGALPNEASGVATQIASIPADAGMPPPLEEPAPKLRSLMNYVDIVFEVKNKEVSLYQNPGSDPTGDSLPIGTKGKADFEVLIGEDHWYQVKTKKGSGWVNGKSISMFNLSPGSDKPAVAAKTAPPKNALDGGRSENTYFEASSEATPTFDKPSDAAKPTGSLSMDTAYLAVRSEKVGPNRWFLLQIRSGETAWARGIDLRLADVQQPASVEAAAAAQGMSGSSAFAAEWVKASVKGVGVYATPSISAKIIREISPREIYKVVETMAANGKEWYRIELPGGKEGWVQTMDVNLTKPE